MRNSFKVATIGGIDILINASWLLAFAIITWSLGYYYHTTFSSWDVGTAYIVGAVSALLLFVTVLIHELSHSFTARANGLPVREITLFLFGGVSNLNQEPQAPRVELLVALAGPLASLALAGIFYVLHVVAGGAPSEITAVLGYLAWINLVLVGFNLIPGFPLDGGRVLRAVIWQLTGSLRRATQIATSAGRAIGYLFLFGGLLEAFVLGQVVAGIWLAFIGWFLQGSASATYQQTVMDSILMGVDVRDVMDQRVISAPPTASIETLVHDYMLGENRRAIPVHGPDGRLFGLVTLSDVAKVPREQWYSTPVHAIMTRGPEVSTVSPTDDLRTALRTLAEHDYDQLPVVEDGRVVGMLNRGQVLQYLHLRQQLAARAAIKLPDRDDDLHHQQPRVG